MTGRRATLDISEIFGPTLQGEGVSVGRSAVFVRLAGCSVQCRWCDTRYSWDAHDDGYGKRPGSTTVDELWDAIRQRLPERAHPLVVVTGGEPMEQMDGLRALVSTAHAHGCRVEIETSGTRSPKPLFGLVDLFTVSPKLRHAHANRGFSAQHLAEFADTGRAVFKFVVRNRGDLVEAAQIADPYPSMDVIVMPIGTVAEAVRAIARDIADDVARRGWTLSPRMHIDLWGDQPGR